MVAAKVPRRPAQPLQRTPADVLRVRPRLTRIARTIGRHTLAWNHLRHFGPLPNMRWDPHPPPLQEHPSHAVGYAAPSITSALAEVFQTGHIIDVNAGRPHLIIWQPLRALRLLDLTGTWPIRNGAAYALQAAPKATCRTWSNQIFEQWPDLDGLWVPSTMTGQPIAVLGPAAAASFPSSPDLNLPLNDPSVYRLVVLAAATIGYRTS